MRSDTRHSFQGSGCQTGSSMNGVFSAFWTTNKNYLNILFTRLFDFKSMIMCECESGSEIKNRKTQINIDSLGAYILPIHFAMVPAPFTTVDFP